MSQKHKIEVALWGGLKPFADGNDKVEVEAAKIAFRSGEENRYGIQPAITQAAQGVDSFDRRVDLERAGGELLSWDSKQWEKIALLA